jgi:hypothetical protein
MSILRLSTLSLTLAIAIFTLGYGNHSVAGKKCDEDDQHPSCKPDDSGDLVVYTAELTAGAFKFDLETVDLTLNSYGNGLQSDSEVTMTRPDPVNDANDASQWDTFFNVVCMNLLGTVRVESIKVAAGNFEITRSSSNDMRVILHDILLSGKNEKDAKVTVQLIAHEPVPVPEVFPATGETNTVTFTYGAIYGRSKKGGPGGSQGCQESGGGSFEEFPLSESSSVLDITAPAAAP